MLELLLVGNMLLNKPAPQFYPEIFVVCENDGEELAVSTTTGQVFAIKEDDTEDIFEEDIVALIMCDNGTPEDITDDWFVDGSLRYCGYQWDAFTDAYYCYWAVEWE